MPSLKVMLAKSLPQPILNKILLRFPSFYRNDFVNYESYLDRENGIPELLNKFEEALAVEGDVIECGCARAGTSVIMGTRIEGARKEKTVYALDTFDGFDKGEIEKEVQAGNVPDYSDHDFKYNSYEYVQQKLKRLGLTKRVIPVKGLFQDTMKEIRAESYCFGFIDCDLEDSLLFATREVWKKLSHGGIIMMDDYNSDQYRGVTKAVDKLVKEFGSNVKEHKFLKRLYYIKKA